MCEGFRKPTFYKHARTVRRDAAQVVSLQREPITELKGEQGAAEHFARHGWPTRNSTRQPPRDKLLPRRRSLACSKQFSLQTNVTYC